jgi:spermidine synthase
MDRFRFSFLFIGFGSIISQIILVREFLVSFYGNELSIGIIFFSWLFWIGLGSGIGNLVIYKIKNHLRIFSILIIIAPVITFLQILVIKFSRYFLNTPVGEYISILELIYFSFIVLSVGCFIWGMLFTIGSYISSKDDEGKWMGVNKVYIYETLGSVLGGLLFSFFLVSVFSTFQIISLLVILSLVIVSFQFSVISRQFSVVSYQLTEGNGESSFNDQTLPTGKQLSANNELLTNSKPDKVKNKPFLTILVISILPGIFFISLKPLADFEWYAVKFQWSIINDKLNFIESKNTKYQNLSVLELQDQYTIFSDGKPIYNIPNTYNAEIFIHSVMIQSDDPKRVLIIGGGFNGLINEILKYKVDYIDYVELDPKIIDFTQNYLSQSEKQNLLNLKVEIIDGDGRDYINKTKKEYDVIILNVGEPSTAGLNRFFTYEFYQECNAKLDSDGIMAFSFTSSADYFGEDLKNLNASLYSTFKQVFPNLTVVPGTTAILVGSKSSSPLITNTDILAKRYVDKNIKSSYFSGFIYEQLMPKDRVDFYISTMEGVNNPKINFDMNPITYYYEMILWNKFLKGENKLLDEIFRLNNFIWLGIIILPLLIIYFVNFKNSMNRVRVTMLITMFIGGLVGIVYSLIIILNYQTIFGSIYEMVGSMIAANMLGLGIGSIIISRINNEKIRQNILLIIIIMTIIFTFLLPFILEFLISIRVILLSFIIMFLYGCIIGSLFTATNRAYLAQSNKLGSIYSWDVIGSSMGSLIASSIFIPVFGISKTCLLLAFLLSFALIIHFVNKFVTR